MHCPLENPESFMTKNLENSEKYPGKLLNLSLKFGWQLCSEKIIMAEVSLHVNVGFSYCKLNLIHGAPLGQDFTKSYQCFCSEHLALSEVTSIQESIQNRNSRIRWKAKENSRFRQVK